MSTVFWTRAQKQIGLELQQGMIVVRPGWAAFLPTQAAQNLAGMLLLAGVGGVRLSQRPSELPLDAWWAAGEDAFDARVTEALRSSGGVLLTPSDAEVVPTKRSAQLQWRSADGKRGTILFQGRRAPLPLLQAWPRGAPTVDAKDAVLMASVASALPAFAALVCGVGSVTKKDPSMLWGVVGWGAIVVALWLVVGVRFVRARRQNAKTLGVGGPYRTA
jgi:hypothetical protein